MSGGSYNYLCNKQPDDLLSCREDLERARDDLIHYGAGDVAGVVSEILALATVYRQSVDPRMAAIEHVLHELEWWQSNDHSEADFRKAVNEYRAREEEQRR